MCRNLYTSGYYEFMHISSINDKLAVMGFRIVFYGSFIIETLLVDKKKKKRRGTKGTVYNLSSLLRQMLTVTFIVFISI